MGPIDITVTYIKPAEKNYLATIITEKLWQATKQKQIHDLPPKTGNQNLPA